MQRVGPLYLDTTDAALKTSSKLQTSSLVLPDGEAYKDMPTMMKILDHALETRLDRKATFVALGGGVIGDMVGFAAAIYQRGVNFIQVSGAARSLCSGAVMTWAEGGEMWYSRRLEAGKQVQASAMS